ncbi:DUF1150 domain-containing protein [Siculibacillus lacustris]|uniref:DUF1150 domain-containing protein n=1 Tax=Siculibacillus lacustris TaxID=1549641 RepID=A0A4Q9VXZ9_9HYPH|nr:DUF1150 domain-containing protein [Siculibacillus lacustris]TBW41260.1 DUF1150 domain-containing protein [Siculibacillus lacustris]
MNRSTHPPLPIEDFAQLGEGAIAYVREFRSEEIGRLYPGAPPLPAGLRLWALIGAGGTPILISDDRDAILDGAREQELTPVMRH